MHFEQLRVDLIDAVIHDALIGDEVYSGAFVDWKGYGSADKRWMFSRLRDSFAAWPGVDLGARAWTLTGTPVSDGRSVALSLSLGEPGCERPAPAWATLTDAQRAAVLAPLDDVLESIQALLLIYG